MKRKKKEGKRHEGMKTALGGGSQHREKDVNDSGGKGINNAGLPLPLCPNVPLSSSLSLFYPLPPPFCIFLPHSFSLLYSALICPLYCQVSEQTSRGSYPLQAYVTSQTSPQSSPAGCRFKFVHQLSSYKLFRETFDEIKYLQCGTFSHAFLSLSFFSNL